MDERQTEKPRARALAKRRSDAAQKITYLPEGYVPGPDDVMLGRSGESINHIGNQRFRQMVDGCVDKYVRLQKLQKTLLIDELVQRVRQKSPHGGFIKKDKTTGRFYEVGDHMAREKTSQAFRNASIDATYRSSTKAKQLRRNAEKNREASPSYSNTQFARLPALSSQVSSHSQPGRRFESHAEIPAARSWPDFSSPSGPSYPKVPSANQGWDDAAPKQNQSVPPVATDHLFARAEEPRRQQSLSPIPFELEPQNYAQQQTGNHHHSAPPPPPMLMGADPFGHPPVVPSNQPPNFNPFLSSSNQTAPPASQLASTSTMRDKVTHNRGGVAFLESPTRSSSNEEKPKQGTGDDLWEKLLRATEGYDSAEDPFDPTPLPDGKKPPR